MKSRLLAVLMLLLTSIGLAAQGTQGFVEGAAPTNHGVIQEVTVEVNSQDPQSATIEVTKVEVEFAGQMVNVTGNVRISNNPGHKVTIRSPLENLAGRKVRITYKSRNNLNHDPEMKFNN